MKKKIDWGLVAFVICSALLIALIFGAVAHAINEKKEYDEWYNSLSAEEKEAEYNSNIYTYEVLSVNQYVRTETNRFGGVMRTDICYTFTYLDENGNLRSIDDFENLENDYMMVTVGDRNAYIVNENRDGGKTLQLTKETLSKMRLSQSG